MQASGRGLQANGTGLLKSLVIPWEKPHRSSVFLKHLTFRRDPCWSSVWRTKAPREDAHWRSSWTTVSHEGKSVRNPPPQEEGVAAAVFYELTVIPIPHPPLLLLGEGEKIGHEVKPVKNRGVGGR